MPVVQAGRQREKNMLLRVLVVDDEMDIRDILKFNLRSEGYIVDTAESAEEALKLNLESYDLFVLDVMMGPMSGFKLADTIRTDLRLDTPFLFLTAKDEENDLLTGFSLGADDYIKKPFSIVEVKARIKAVLSRSSVSRNEDLVQFGPLSFDRIRKEVRVNNSVIDLTKKEYQLLEMLVENRERFTPREEILDRLWSDTFVTERTVDVHMARLRKRLGRFGSSIRSKSGYGYFIDLS